jgi:hypothetical protein
LSPFSFFCIEKSFQNGCKDQTVSSFNCSVALGVVDRGESELDIEIATEVSELGAIELLSIVYCYISWHSKATDDPLLDETDQCS